MKLKERVLNYIKDRRDKVLNGGINSIPSPFPRFSEDFLGIEQGKYHVITSFTKGGKTQFASYVFIFHVLMYAYTHPEQIRAKIFYYPLEETPEDVMTRFMCHILYSLSNGKVRVSPTELASTKSGQLLDNEVIELLESEEYSKILDFFETHIIFSTSTNPTGCWNECRKYAEEHGTVHKKKQLVKDEFEGTKEIEIFDWYEPDDPDEYRIIFWDHISLTSTERGMTLKQSIDKLSEYFVHLRNRYKFSPVVIQQQSFESEGLEAIKMNKIRPTVAGLADSKYTARDCNICIGLFSPLRFELREYGNGYDITRLKDNVRFAEMLINRGGSPGGMVALYFDGKVNYFNELPPVTDKPALERVYRWVESLRKPVSRTFMIVSLRKTMKKLRDLI